MNTATTFHSPSVLTSRRQVKFGCISAITSLLLGVTVHMSATWALDAGVKRLVYFGLPDWGLILWAHLISGATTVTAMLLLVPPGIRRISRPWLRRLTAVLVGLAATAAALPWLVYFVGIGINALTDYTLVTAENGEKVLVQKPGYDPADYAVYRQESFFVYQRSTDGTSVSDIFEPDDCTLTGHSAGLLLTCGADIIPVPPLSE
ncbi:hypothetical protein [Arthrobacter globiformis]|nr:hypothetical protein [Arthrobacter globiformis]